MQIKQVQYFLQIAESGSFSFAAEELLFPNHLYQNKLLPWKKNWGFYYLIAVTEKYQ